MSKQVKGAAPEPPEPPPTETHVHLCFSFNASVVRCLGCSALSVSGPVTPSSEETEGLGLFER